MNANIKYKPVYLAQEWIEASERIKALAHPIRLYIISLLKTEKEMTVTALQNALDLEQALVSHHINILKNREVLKCRREGKNIFYSLKNKKLLNVLSCIETNLE